MKTKITKKQFFTLIDTSKYLIEIANMDYSQGEFVDPNRTLNLASEIDKIVWDLIPDDADRKDDETETVVPNREQIILDRLQKLMDRCVQMKESYENNIDIPECQLDWLKNYKNWQRYFEIADSEGYDHGYKIAPKPPFSWESVVVGGDTEA